MLSCFGGSTGSRWMTTPPMLRTTNLTAGQQGVASNTSGIPSPTITTSSHRSEIPPLLHPLNSEFLLTRPINPLSGFELVSGFVFVVMVKKISKILVCVNNYLLRHDINFFDALTRIWAHVIHHLSINNCKHMAGDASNESASWR